MAMMDIEFHLDLVMFTMVRCFSGHVELGYCRTTLGGRGDMGEGGPQGTLKSQRQKLHLRL